ncbi:hypothetical protein [Rhizohabitans arisaemae]|uniref:hypothetical protein n=1 Tax=Rhizohabitans arisaemae TaxID=2720610 RepID=UPI0024B13522|nr:hypothetical protein [Rhizohabitans arisaemae]
MNGDKERVTIAGESAPCVELLIGIARTGELGPLRCGMTLGEVQEHLGPFHDRMRDRRPRRWRPRLYFWNDLEVLICFDRVIGITVPMWQESLDLPAVVTGWEAPCPPRVPYETVVAALDASGITWVDAPEEVMEDARAIRIPRSNTLITFWAVDGSSRTYKVFMLPADRNGSA